MALGYKKICLLCSAPPGECEGCDWDEDEEYPSNYEGKYDYNSLQLKELRGYTD